MSPVYLDPAPRWNPTDESEQAILAAYGYTEDHYPDAFDEPADMDPADLDYGNSV